MHTPKRMDSGVFATWIQCNGHSLTFDDIELFDLSIHVSLYHRMNFIWFIQLNRKILTTYHHIVHAVLMLSYSLEITWITFRNNIYEMMTISIFDCSENWYRNREKSYCYCEWWQILSRISFNVIRFIIVIHTSTSCGFDLHNGWMFLWDGKSVSHVSCGTHTKDVTKDVRGKIMFDLR